MSRAFLQIELALAGPAIGVWLRRRSLPTDRRTLLVAGVVLAVLFAGPYAVGAAVDDGSNTDTFDPETGGDDQDDPEWNESETDVDETNETEENGSDDNASDSDTCSGETQLSSLLCDADAASDLPTDDTATPLNASNVSVHHYLIETFYEDKHVLMLDVETVPGDVVGASAVATNDSAFPTSFAAVGADGGEFHAPADEATRVWIDVDGEEGVERYSVDLCPDAAESES